MEPMNTSLGVQKELQYHEHVTTEGVCAYASLARHLLCQS